MTHLFTTYVDIIDDSNIKDLYVNELIPQWVKVNSRYIDNITLITNVPHFFNKIKGLKVLEIPTSDAFCNYTSPEKKIFHHQVGCWKYFLDTIPYNDVALYMDPDAFMIDNTLLTISDKVKDHQLSKKRFKYGESDAGVSLLRNTHNTKNMINGVIELLKHHTSDCIIEAYYDQHFKLNPEFFISWKDHTLCLRDQICGINKKINTIHGIYNLPLTSFNKEEQKITDIIHRKELLRVY